MNPICKTRSVCPVCLKELPAELTEHPDGIYMEKVCSDHGRFETLIWQDNREGFLQWMSRGGCPPETWPLTEEQLEAQLSGADFTCESCQSPSSAALMTTNRCNMNCPVCFTRDRQETIYEPSLEECEKLLRSYRERAGEDALLEFCGGEPTVREDLPALVRLAHNIGFDYIQLNTNGIRLSENVSYCRQLREAGITTVYLGFDGVTDRAYQVKYGRSLLEEKKKAVANCKEAGLAVVLVVCVIAGENDGELGEIVRYAKAQVPTVKGVYLQPISYFGIYPENLRKRVTIPELIRRLADQCEDISKGDFGPCSYEHPQCSFNACYLVDRDDTLWSLSEPFSSRCVEGQCASRVRKVLRNTWMPSRTRMLTIGGMAFQDAWNIDLLRVRRCSIQIIQKDGRLLPLCSKYLSSCGGGKLFPGIG